MFDVKEQMKSKKLKKGEYEMLTTQKYDEKSKNDADLNVNHFD